MNKDSPSLDENHVYRDSQGRVLAGVTSVIRANDSGWEVDEWYLHRGSMVHKAIHLYLKRQLDWSSVDERIKGRVEAVVKFLHDTGLEPVAVEVALHSAIYNFAGTLDFYGKTPLHFVLADWKGTLSPHCEPQIGAYSLLLQERGDHKVDVACAVETHDDGTYKIRWFDLRQIKRAQQVWLAMLTVNNWKAQHNLLKKKGQ